jgi:hypothetical protein
MDNPQLILPFIGLAVAILGMMVLAPRVLSEQANSRTKRKGYSHTCPNCSYPIQITRESLRKLDLNESALVIRDFPNAPQHELAEKRCPSCKAILSFRTDEWPPVFLTFTLIDSGGISHNCPNCRAHLDKPGFPIGAYDGDNEALCKLPRKHGLTCSRCDAACCVECVLKASLNRPGDGSLLCPRCFRGPVDKVHHY